MTSGSSANYKELYRRPNIIEPEYESYRFLSRLQPGARHEQRSRVFEQLGRHVICSADSLDESVVEELLRVPLVENLLGGDPLQFGAPRPRKPDLPARPCNPLEGAQPPLQRLPPEPILPPLTRANYALLGVTLGPINSFITGIRRSRAAREYAYRHGIWEREVRHIEIENKKVLKEHYKLVKTSQQYTYYIAADAFWVRQAEALDREYEDCMSRWYAHRHDFEEEKQQELDYFAGVKAAVEYGQADAIEYIADLSLKTSHLPWGFCGAHAAHYDAEGKVLLLDYELPDLERVVFVTPTAKGSKPMTQKKVQDVKERAKYAFIVSVLVGMAKLLQGSPVGGIALNGHVTFIDKATGNERTEIILSIFAPIQELLPINLSQIDPKSAFKALKGISAGGLTGYIPVPPVMHYNTADRRIVEGREVISGLVEDENIAAMPWEDFEHLIRELFEKEFGANGIEVKVTRASRDSGVDAIAFDPEPIRGGKFVIQAKRYTRTVDVSAVRDLYGTVQSEGANRGILVTTSKFGPDSREFERGKPITLLDGANLLALLNKHGYRFSIDLDAARKILSEKGWL